MGSESKPIKLIKHGLARLGVEIKRLEPPPGPARLFDDAMDAMIFAQGGKPAAFLCPLERCRHYTGLSFSDTGWHPFIEAMVEYSEKPGVDYGNSVLKKFYERWKPRNAAEAIAGFADAPRDFHTLSPHLMLLSPWSSLSGAELDAYVRWWNHKDNSENGHPDFSIDEHGWAYFGPVHPAKGNMEFERLVKVHSSIRSRGYDRAHGDIGVTLIKRGSEYVYLVGGGGFHRAAVMAALDYDVMPAIFHRPSIVDVDDVDHWPQVRNGLWGREQARRYVDHIFEFDSRAWARDRNLLKGVHSLRPTVDKVAQRHGI